MLLAATFNGCMDVITHHFAKSVFRNLDPKWWNPNESWKHVKPFLGWVRLDAWHLFKFGMLFCFCAMAVTYKHVTGFDYFIFLILWGIGFEITYKVLWTA